MTLPQAIARILGVAMLVVATLGVAASAPPQLRLPDTVVPTNYELQLTLDPDADEYAGAVRIGIRIAVPIDLVWINATRLQLDDVVAVVDSGVSAGLRAEVIPGNDDVVGLQFASPLPAGTATLTVHFTGRFSASEVAGLFKQKEAGDWYVLTQMEPLWARRAFPCFDEPRFRAPWQITLTVPEHQRAFSNMPVESERVAHSGWREVRFQPSPSMATYLVAIAVGPFDVLDGGIAGRNATPLRYIAPKGRAAEAAYAASITPRILERLEAYFGQPFPFPKLDSISIPNSGYTFGAMENIGLITYDQSLLLAKPEETTTRFQQSYVSVAAHEISHQWFGDLVTPLWWNDIWLNESFASWLGDKITGEVKPEWRWDFRRIDGRAWAITSDRLASARRIRQPIEVRSDVRSAFDGISYSKGQSVLAMFENWLGPDKFRAGVRRYMAQHAWGVATADDFFAALVAEDDALLPAFRDFVDRSGVPILTIALDCASGARLVLSQKRFLPRGSTGDPAQRWVFPACFEYGDATKAATQCTLIKDEASELGLNTKSCPQWVIGNRGAIGYFLPALSPQLYAAVANAGLLIGPTDWYALLSDSDILARSAAVPLPDALSLAALASAQKDPRVFGAAVGVAEGVPRALTTGAQGIRYAAWARGRFGPRARALGWQPHPGEDADTRRLRRVVVPFVADRGGDAALAREARQRAGRWPQDPNAVSPDVRGPLLITAAITAGRDAPALYAHMVSAATAERNAKLRRDLIEALGWFRDPSAAAGARELMLTGPFVPVEALLILRAQLDNDATRAEALAWLDAHYDDLAARGAQDDFEALPHWADNACSASERAAFVKTLAQRMQSVDGGPRGYAKSLEKIDLCIAYRAVQEPALIDWLAMQMGGQGQSVRSARPSRR